MSWNEEFRELKNAEFGYRKRNRYPEVRPVSFNQDEYVLVGDHHVIYRRMQFRFQSTFIFFRAGTANPVAYSGRLGRCLMDRVRKDDGTCSFSKDDRLYIDGFAWPAEGPKTKSLRELSQRRVHLLKAHLSSTGLPTKAVISKAHGATRTRARIDADAPVIGLSFTVMSKFHGTPAEPLKFRECETTQWNPRLLKRLRRFIASNRVEPSMKCRGCGSHTVLYRNDADGIEQYGPHGVLSRIKWPRTAVMVWAHQLRQHGCDLDKSPLPHQIHPDHPWAIPFARQLPERAKDAVLPLIF